MTTKTINISAIEIRLIFIDVTNIRTTDLHLHKIKFIIFFFFMKKNLMRGQCGGAVER